MPQQLISPTHPVPEDVVLVVDDDPNVLNLVVRLLELAGYKALACSSPSEVIDRLGKARVVAVVSDISMPEMSGFALTLRVHEEEPELPVVLMTGGQADPELPTIAFDFGAFAFLQKPFEAGQLWATMRRALEYGPRAIEKRAG